MLQHSASALAEAGYQHELPVSGKTYVNIDFKHMGVGGDNSWSRSVLPAYFVPPGTHRLVRKVAAASSVRDAALCRKILLGNPASASTHRQRGAVSAV